MRKIFYFLSLSLIMVACNENAGDAGADSADNNVVELKGQVMKIHDETMSKNGDIQSLLSNLKMATYSNSEDSIAIQQAYKGLKEANQSMMDWMREYSKNFDESMADAEKEIFLKAELEKMTAIENATNEALSIGNSTLANINSAE